MDDYSCTIPTGTTIGKVWRRREPYRCTEEEAKYYVGMYVESNKSDFVDITWLPVVHRHGPEPRHYEPPDWSNYQAWLSSNKLQR